MAPAFGGGENQHRGGDTPVPAAPVPAPVPRENSDEKGVGGKASWKSAFAAQGKDDALEKAPEADVAPARANSFAALVGEIGPPPTSSLLTVARAESQCDMPKPVRGLSGGAEALSRPLIPLTLGGVSSARVHATAGSSFAGLGGVEMWDAIAKMGPGSETSMILATKASLLAKPGGDVIDLGAWTGAPVISAIALGARSVLALEPDPRAYDELWANVKANPVAAAATWALRHCVSDREETRTIKTQLGSTAFRENGYSHRDENTPGAPLVEYTVNCSPLKSIIASSGMSLASVSHINVNALPGMELIIAGSLYDWVRQTPAGTKKPGIWLTLYLHKWGDKALGEKRRQKGRGGGGG